MAAVAMCATPRRPAIPHKTQPIIRREVLRCRPRNDDKLGDVGKLPKGLLFSFCSHPGRTAGSGVPQSGNSVRAPTVHDRSRVRGCNCDGDAGAATTPARDVPSHAPALPPLRSCTKFYSHAGTLSTPSPTHSSILAFQAAAPQPLTFLHARTLTESPNSPSTRLARSRPHRKTWVRHSKPPWLAASSGRAHFLSRPWQRSWVWRSKPPTSEAGLGFSTPKRPSLP